MLEDLKDIFVSALSIEVHNTQSILIWLAKFVQKFNEDINEKDKFLQRAERNFENKVLEQVIQKIAINQVELSTILSSL